MHNPCVLAVDNRVKSPLVEQLFYTPTQLSVVLLWILTSFYSPLVPMFYRLFPTAFFAFSPLFQQRFSPLSTAPITRTTFSEKNYR